MDDPSGQNVGNIEAHNIPNNRVDPTVEQGEIGRRLRQIYGVSRKFQTVRFLKRRQLWTIPPVRM
jgi:hypothetical protein